jgi:hypothetical protein
MFDGALGIGDTVGVLGEVHTGLLRHSTALPPRDCGRLLAVFQGEQVIVSERPIGHVSSPERLTGVDCHLNALSGNGVRGIGSVGTRTSITGGHVLQASSAASLARSPTGRRMPWTHYLAQPGCVELIGAFDPSALARGFLVEPRPPATLDLGAVTARAVDAVQGRAELDRLPPFRTARTALRWAATIGPDPSVQFSVERGQRRTAHIVCDRRHLTAAAEFCVDLALHDWLLTTLLGQVQRSGIGTALRPDVALRLAPAVDHLLHLWMPAARTSAVAASFWDGMQRRPGLSRQWQVTVDRIRDQLALSTIGLLTAARKEIVG